MEELSVIKLCQALANLTSNRCTFMANSNTCRCIGDVMHSNHTPMISSAPEIMLSEVFLIFFVLAIWLSTIGFCLNQYKSLRRLETQVHYCVNRKDPVNIGDIKIVTREQDSIIYKKKRYSTLLDTHINPQKLTAMHYVQQYLPKAIPTALSALVISRNDLATVTNHQTSEYPSLTPYFRTDMDSIKRYQTVSRTGSARYSTGLTVPRLSPSSSSHSSWHENGSTRHLGIPLNSLGSNCYSVGDISFPVPNLNSKPSNDRLLDPRLISSTVRRSLLALHRESQENVNLLKKKKKTRSENDVRGALTALKSRMKSKSKCAQQQQQQQQFRPHSNTLSILPQRTNSNEHEEQSIPLLRRSLIHYPKCSIENETVQNDSPLTKSVFHSMDEDESIKTVEEELS